MHIHITKSQSVACNQPHVTPAPPARCPRSTGRTCGGWVRAARAASAPTCPPDCSTLWEGRWAGRGRTRTHTQTHRHTRMHVVMREHAVAATDAWRPNGQAMPGRGCGAATHTGFGTSQHRVGIPSDHTHGRPPLPPALLNKSPCSAHSAPWRLVCVPHLAQAGVRFGFAP